MTPNYPVWQIAFNIIQLILTFAVWWSSRNKVTNDRFTQLENSKIKLESDLKHLKLEMAKHKPACDNHSRMEDNDKRLFTRLDEVHGDVREIKGSLEGVKNLSAVINQFLLKQGGEK